jgi:hypothetical protein
MVPAVSDDVTLAAHLVRDVERNRQAARATTMTSSHVRMGRIILAVGLIASCKSHESAPEPVETVRPPRAAGATQTARRLPSDFPSIGAPTVAGTVAGKRFEVAKAMLHVTPDSARLELYSWSEGSACEPQFSPRPDQLYVSVMFPGARAKVGEKIGSGDADFLVVYKTPTLDAVAGKVATLVLDRYGPRASGRLKLTAPDGTNIAGTFDALVCESAQHAREPSALLGLSWGAVDVDPTTLPHDAVTTLALGKTAPPVAVEAIDWQDSTLGQHELHFFLEPPAHACAFDLMSPGFKIGFPAAFKAGDVVRATVTTVTPTGAAFGVVQWSEPGDVIGVEGGGWVSAIIDTATPGKLHGRVFAWFQDPSKSMIAGAFTATRCHASP